MEGGYELADVSNEKHGYSFFEKFMFFVIPILFTVVLLGVLLSLFNFDIRNKVLEIGAGIPLLNTVLPAPEQQLSTSDELPLTETEQIAALEKQLKQKDAENTKLVENSKTLRTQISSLKKQLDTVKKANEKKTIELQQYTARIKGLADTYAVMSPSKAAPIIESLSTDEAALVLNAMRSDAQAKILAKMTPAVAAEVSMKIKDTETVKDQQIAALQARIVALQTTTAPTSSGINMTQIQQTFSTMDAKSAASLLLTMADVNQTKVSLILSALDSSTRSKILPEMSKVDATRTATILSKIVTSN